MHQKNNFYYTFYAMPPKLTDSFMEDITIADLIKTIIMMKEFRNVINPITKKSLFLQILNCPLWFLVEPVTVSLHEQSTY